MHSRRAAYLLDGEGADNVLCQGLCFDQGDFDVSVDLCVIGPVAHTLHLQGRTGTVRVSGQPSMSGRLIWPSRPNKLQGDLSGLAVKGFPAGQGKLLSCSVVSDSLQSHGL